MLIVIVVAKTPSIGSHCVLTPPNKNDDGVIAEITASKIRLLPVGFVCGTSGLHGRRARSSPSAMDSGNVQQAVRALQDMLNATNK